MDKSNSLSIKLQAYAELTGKSEAEAIYDALSIALEVRRKNIDLIKICALIEKENEMIRTKQFFLEQKEKYLKDYYQRNKNTYRKRKEKQSD